MQQLVELVRRDAHHRLFLADQAFLNHLDGAANGGHPGTLAVAGLQHIKLAVFDSELEILNVAGALFKLGRDVDQLGVSFGHLLGQVRDGLRRANAGDDVFALRIEQVLAIDHAFAGRGVACKADTGSGADAHVAEDHGLDVGGGADLVGDLFHFAIVVGLGVPPAIEDGVAREFQLFQRILREWLLSCLDNDLLVFGNDGLQIGGGKVGVELGLAFGLLGIEGMVEQFHVDFERHLAEHLNEAAVAIVGETGVACLSGETFYGLVIHTEVEDSVHHAGHGELGAGPHAEQQRVVGIAQLLAHHGFELAQRGDTLVVDLGRDFTAIFEENGADFSRNGEPWGHRHLVAAHLREARAFATEDFFHLSISISGTAAEGVNVLLHQCSLRIKWVN